MNDIQETRKSLTDHCERTGKHDVAEFFRKFWERIDREAQRKDPDDYLLDPEFDEFM